MKRAITLVAFLLGAVFLSPPANAATGTALPHGDIPHWHQTLALDFNAPATFRDLPVVYPTVQYFENFADKSGFGNYTSTIVSAGGGILDIAIKRGQVATILPAGWNGQLYGRVSWRMQADVIAGYKLEGMWWSARDVWADGELDAPEGTIGGTMAYYFHNAVGQPVKNAVGGHLPATITENKWHVYTQEWSPTLLRFLVDGKVVGQTSSKTAIPTHKMRWELQTQVNSLTMPRTAGHVRVDWITLYSWRA